MEKDLAKIEHLLKQFLEAHQPALQVRVNTEKNFEVAGTIPTMQGKQKVEGHYFASIMPKPKDIRLYFFPIYTHKDEFQLSEALQKKLKGKSCFHIKKLEDDVALEIEAMIAKGVEVYKASGLV